MLNHQTKKKKTHKHREIYLKCLALNKRPKQNICVKIMNIIYFIWIDILTKESWNLSVGATSDGNLRLYDSLWILLLLLFLFFIINWILNFIIKFNSRSFFVIWWMWFCLICTEFMSLIRCFVGNQIKVGSKDQFLGYFYIISLQGIP